jgi:receptor protein-tyrosine kinase
MSGNPMQRSLAERAVEALGGVGVLRGDGVPPTAEAPAGAGPSPTRPGADAPAPAGGTPAAPTVITRATLLGAHGYTLEAERSRCSEEMTVVQQQVMRTLQSLPTSRERNRRLVLVTSSRPGEGKSFTSLNLSISLARSSGASVLLVDADGKLASLSHLLGVAEERGLWALASTPNLPAAQLARPTEIETLSFLPFGAPPTVAATEAPGNALAAALLRIADAFPRHVIVVDTPPVLSISEASILAPVVGQVLLVVQAEITQRSEVEAALDMLDACPTLQLVLNQSRVSSPGSFGAYGYAYGYKYKGAYLKK